MILCCGEALIDMLPAPLADGGTGWTARLGGSVFNTAIALARLGTPSGLLTGLSTDAFGRRLDAALQADGVDASLSIRSPRKTALAFVDLVDGQASYSFHDEGSAGRSLRMSDMPSVPERSSALFFGGISLASDPCGGSFEGLHARAAGRRVTMIDPNIRPAFIADEAVYRRRLERMFSTSDIVKVSEEDLDWLMPGETSTEAKMREILEGGPSIVIATRGAGGAQAIARQGVEAKVEATPVEVVDTVGAGDTFNAGFLAALHEAGLLSVDGVRSAGSADLEAALRLGASAAAVSVARAGAQPPYADELDGPARR